MALTPYSKGGRVQGARPVARVGRHAPRTAGARGAPVAQGGLRASRTNQRTGTRSYSRHEPAFGGNGEINANSLPELMRNIGEMMAQAQVGAIETRYQMDPSVLQERAAMLREAAEDRSGETLQVLGEVLVQEIWETMNREGFTRKLWVIKPVAKGDTARIRIRQKDVLAMFVTSDANATEQRIRQTYVYPPEFYLLAYILIEDRELEQASTDLLDEKFQDGLEAIMVKEDNLCRLLMNRAAAAVNDLVFFNQFTPAVFTSLRSQIAGWGIPVPTALIAYDLWDDIIADPDFSAWFDPVSKHELILEGKLGSILDVELITDGFKHDTHKVLEPGEVFFCGAPINFGAITERKPLVSEAITGYNVGRPAKGWFMEQIEGLTLVNARAEAKGQRV